MKFPHLVFNVAYDGIARELISPAVLVDPLSGVRVPITRAIWDTGATNSVVSIEVVEKLHLVPTGQTQVVGFGGASICNTYLVSLLLSNDTVKVEGLSVSDGDLGSDEMLIGMDVIAMGDFTVQSFAGKTHFAFAVPPFPNKYDMLEKANSINARLAKKQR